MNDFKYLMFLKIKCLKTPQNTTVKTEIAVVSSENPIG